MTARVDVPETSPDDNALNMSGVATLEFVCSCHLVVLMETPPAQSGIHVLDMSRVCDAKRGTSVSVCHPVMSSLERSVCVVGGGNRLKSITLR